MIVGSWSSVTITVEGETVDLTPFVKQIEIERAEHTDPGDASRRATPPSGWPPVVLGQGTDRKSVV